MKAALVLNDTLFLKMLSIELRQRGISSKQYIKFDEAIGDDNNIIFVDEDTFLSSTKQLIKCDVVIFGSDKAKDEYDFKYYQRPFVVKDMLDEVFGPLDKMHEISTSNFTIIDNIRLHQSNHSISYKGESISLSKKEFLLLKLLLENKGKVVSREDAQFIFGSDEKTNIVDVYINYLRKKIDDKLNTKLIKSIRGKGYIISD